MQHNFSSIFVHVVWYHNNNKHFLIDLHFLLRPDQAFGRELMSRGLGVLCSIYPSFSALSILC